MAKKQQQQQGKQPESGANWETDITLHSTAANVNIDVSGNTPPDATTAALVEQLKGGEPPEIITQVEPVSSEDDPLLTQSQVARMCGKSPQTIGRWIADGLLAFHRQPNGLLAIRKSAVDRFLGASCLKVSK